LEEHIATIMGNIENLIHGLGIYNNSIMEYVSSNIIDDFL
jgi:hypothetical protein